MFSKSTTNRWKAAAIAALMCVSMAAVVTVPSMTHTMNVSAAATTIGVSLEERPEDAADDDKTGVYRGKTCALASSGIKTITFTCIPEESGSFVWGFGINLDKDPWWKDGLEGKVTSVTAGEEFTVTVDVSKLNLGYNPVDSEWASEYEFRNYYCNGGSVKVVSAEANAKTTEPTEDATEDETTKPTEAPSGPSGGSTWSFKDNGDGTGTMTADLARSLDFFDEPYTLTKGYDEDYYTEKEQKWVEGKDPINSHKFLYGDFGLSGIGAEGTTVINSLTATIQSEVPVKTFMYGGGLNVEKGSAADTESAKAEAGQSLDPNAGYWYNDMGEEKIEEYEKAGVAFGVTPGTGVTLKSGTDTTLGEYFSVKWDVPEEVRPFETSGSVSFQFWYGEEDAEEYTELEKVDLVSGMVSYTEQHTFDYTNTVSYKVGEEIDMEKSAKVSFKDAGVPLEDGETNVHAVVFHLSASDAMDKLVYGIGASVDDDFQMWSDSEGGDKWNYVITDTDKKDIQIVWMVPDGVDLNEEYGEILFGYWYGDVAGDAINSVTLDSVDFYYDTKEAATEAPTEKPTEKPTEAPTEKPTEKPTEAPTEAPTSGKREWGDVDCNGSVEIIDVIALNRNLLMGEEIKPEGKLNADVNQNGTPDEADALAILQYIVHILDELPLSTK